MAVDQSTRQRRLKDGIEAIRAGNTVRGRDLLLEVVQADRDNEAAWWWLAHATDSVQEQMRALEQVVRLNPAQAEAHQALLVLRTQQVANTATYDRWASLLPETPLEADDGLDDPYQCPYCGRPTNADAHRCPHCQGGLVVRVARAASAGAVQLLLLLLGVNLAVGLLELAAPLLALASQQNPNQAQALGTLGQVLGLKLLLGNYLALSAATAWLLIQILVVRAGLLAAILLGLRERWSLAFYAAILGLLADLLLGLYLLITGYLGPVAALANLLLTLVTAVLLFGVANEFAVNAERLMVRPDTGARSALDFYKRGHRYRQQGMWALAVAQWRKAVGLAPQVPLYYKHLGIGYAQIKRFARSLRALEEAQRQAPADEEITEIIALVQAKADTHTLLKR